MITIRKLYKYLQEPHASSMIQDGTLRIGTLYSYRELELGPAIGDPHEGRSETSHAFPERVDVTQAQNRSWVVDTLFDLGDATNVSIEGLTLTVDESQPDCYIYCATYKFSGAAMRAFGAEACVVIDRPEAFIQTVVDALLRQGQIKSAEVSPCDYSGRLRDHTMPRVSAAFLKNPEYEYQKEVRLVMEPAISGVLEPFVVTIPELSQFCSRRD